MKKKFSLIVLLLILIPFSVQASLSPKCYEMFDKIKSSTLPNLQNFQKYENSTYGFDPIWILERNKKNEIVLDDEDDANWILKRDENNYPYVGRITSSKVINDLRFGDKIISVNGQALDKLDDDTISDLLLIIEDNQNINSDIKFERNGEIFVLNLDLLTNLQQDDKVRIVIQNISEISQIKSTFKADIYLDVEVDFDYDTKNLPLGRIMFDSLVYKDDKDEWDWQQCKNIPEDKIIDFNIPDPGSNLVIKNAVNMNTATSETILDVTPYSEKIGDDTEYEYTQVVSITTGSYELKNDYDLRTFPFDKQKLIFKVANVNKLDNYVIDYKTYTERALNNYVKNGTLNGWDIKGYEIKNLIFKGPINENLSGIEYR